MCSPLNNAFDRVFGLLRSKKITLAVLSLACSLGVAAQTQDEQNATPLQSQVGNLGISSDLGEDDADMEEVFVTGSLLPQGDYNSSAPISTINSQEFEITNTVNLEALLNTMPQILAGEDRTSSMGWGWATADLRGLGVNRSLTLLDGKRMTPTFADGGTVDLNFVPAGLIERVEILTGGASTAYGSDALAGVINIITKEYFEGFELTLGSEATESNDSQIYNASVTWGTAFGDGYGNFMVFADVTERKPLLYAEREGTEYFNEEIRNEDGTGSLGFAPSRWPMGSGGQLFGFGGGGYSFTGSGDISPYSPEDGYNMASEMMLQIPQERQVLFSRLSWEGEGYSLAAQVHYADSDSSTTQAPSWVAPWNLGGPVPVTIEGNPFLSDQAVQTLAMDPFVQAFGMDFNQNGIPDVSNVFIGRVFEENGPTTWQQQYELTQIKLDAEIAVGDFWLLQGTLNAGRVRGLLGATGAFVVDRFKQALLVDPSDPSGNTCLDPSNGCVPINVFGQGNISQAAFDFIGTDLPASNESDLTQVSLLLSGNTGNFFEMPGGLGPIGLAMGVEYLKREQESLVDERVVNGEVDVYGVWPNPIRGELSRTSFLTEASIPLLQELPLASFVELELAFRYTNHSTVDSTTSAKAALSWYLTEDLQLRVSYNQAVRAPSLNELFLDFGVVPNLRGILGFADPCSADGAGSGVDPALCVLTGVPAEQVGSEELNVGFNEIPVNRGGNPDLESETGKTFSLGFVWTPYEIAGLSLSVDYYDIEIEDYIGRLPGNGFQQVNACYFSDNSAIGTGTAAGIREAYCPQIERDAEGRLTRINAGSRNLATHVIRGADLSLNYAFDFGGGLLDLYYVASNIDEKVYEINSGLSNDCAGSWNSILGGDSCSRPVTKWKHRATANWSRDQYQVQLTWRHMSGVKDNDESFEYFVESIDSYHYFEISGRYDWDGGLSMAGGIRNLLDEDPPMLGENSFEANTFPNMYDIYGRTFYLRASYRL